MDPQAPQMQDVRSASTQEMTSPGLDGFKRLLMQAKAEQSAIATELEAAKKAESQAVGAYDHWRRGWLLKRLFKQRFAQLHDAAELKAQVRAELVEQQHLARLSTQIEMPEVARAAYLRMCDAFVVLKGAACIWDTVQERSVNRVVERTNVDRAVVRKPVQFQLGRCEVIDSDWDVPHLGNANGGDLYLYPGFVLCFIAAEAFSLLELGEVQVSFKLVRFSETEAIPADAKVVGRTWAKVNKDGSPDRRFTGNYEIPQVLYGEISLHSPTGMREEYIVSNVEAAQEFVTAWEVFKQAISSGSST